MPVSCSPRIRRSTILAAWTAVAILVTILTARRAHAQAPTPTPTGTRHLHDWDFLVGEWAVRHHRLKTRLAGSSDWEDFPGTLINWPTLGGQGNVGDNVMERPGGTIRGVGIRALDSTTGEWSVWWLPAGSSAIAPPMRGGFLNGIGTFLGDDTLSGKPVKVRVTWSRITPSSAHWEQALSPDGGATWEINWTSDFTRVHP